jgi:hypothetical protein
LASRAPRGPNLKASVMLANICTMPISDHVQGRRAVAGGSIDLATLVRMHQEIVASLRDCCG